VKSVARRHLKNPKVIEKAKTIAVIALVLSAVCLALTVFNVQGRLHGKGELFWFATTPQDVISGTSGDVSNTISAFSVLSEPEFLPIDDDLDVSLQYNDHQMVFGLTGLAVYNVVFAFDFTGEDVFIYISDLYDIFSPEQNGWFLWFGLFFAHIILFGCQR
jgi:hypothetical protein